MSECRRGSAISCFAMASVMTALVWLQTFTSVWADAPLKTVSQVDLERYLGRWYEIARLPNRFQDQCIADVTAEYQRLDNGMILVTNRCQTNSGDIDEAKGIARVVDKASNAKLEVSFVSLFGWQLFWGDYWIIGLADDYSYAVVGTPDRKYGWVLSRTPELSEDSWNEVTWRLKGSGFHPSEFIASR